MEETAREITIEDFKKLEIRTGTVVDVTRVPRTEKLFKVVVDLGKHGKRQTITSLVGYYQAEELMNKRIAFLCNLKGAKFAGQVSQGMVLAASAGDQLALLTIDREIPDGSRVT